MSGLHRARDHDRGDDAGLELVTLASVPTEMEAESMRVVLEDAGVQAWVFSAPIGALGFGASASLLGGIPVQVQLRDLELARRCLAENEQSSHELDWDSVDVGDDDAEVRLAAGRDTLYTRTAKVLAACGAIVAILFLILGVIAIVGVVLSMVGESAVTPRS
ncbi:MAG: hypothetical protein O2819_04145 [Planctomycetota bacterium]|nr:hypothetical protein [Planctomycetota bacterium]MDA1105946.1 hypothetical protein [Planctomycetota bacterium]